MGTGTRGMLGTGTKLGLGAPVSWDPRGATSGCHATWPRPPGGTARPPWPWLPSHPQGHPPAAPDPCPVRGRCVQRFVPRSVPNLSLPGAWPQRQPLSQICPLRGYSQSKKPSAPNLSPNAWAQTERQLPVPLQVWSEQRSLYPQICPQICHSAGRTQVTTPPSPNLSLVRQS